MTDDLRSAETEKKMADPTNPYGDLGALNEALLNKISGGQGKLINQYLDAALPMPEETNNWMPVYEFFRQMTENASKPGATVFGSAAQATSAPMDYLNAKKVEARKTQQARAALGLQIAPSLKPKVTKATYSDPKFYLVSKADGEGGFTTPVERPLTAKQYAELPTDGSVRVTSLPKAGTKFTKRTLYKNDGSTIDVYDQGSYDLAIIAGYGRVKTDDFDNVTVYLEDGSSRVATSQTELDTLIGEGGGGWSRTKPSAGSTAQFKRTVYKDGQELIVYSEQDYDTAISKEGGWSPEKPAPAGPQGSAPERMTSRIFDFVDTFIQSEGTVDSRQLAQFISDVKDMAETETITFVENGVSKTATNPGKDAYDIIEQSYGEDVANAIRDIAIQKVVDDDDDDGDDDEKPLFETIVVAGKEYTIFSTAPKNIPKEAAQGIVDARGGIKDIQIASNLIFPNGVFNKGIVISSNILPGGGVGPSGTLTGDSRTAYQAMKRTIELLLRARSGAAVPDSEVKNYMNLYFPSSFDNAEQARNKLNVLAQYFQDTNQLLSQGKLLYDPTIPEEDRNNLALGHYNDDIHGMPLDGVATQKSSEAKTVVTVVEEFVLDGVRYKQLSDGRTIEEGAE
jgi:hypothetical protein